MINSIKIITGIGIILLLGFYGIIFFFADLGPKEHWITRLLIALLYNSFFGAILTLLFYPKWKLTLLFLWAVTAVSILNIPQSIKEGITSMTQNILMVIIPLLGLLLGIALVLKFKHLHKKSSTK